MASMACALSRFRMPTSEAFWRISDRWSAGLDLIQSLEPDVLCFTGDLVNDHSDEAEPWIDRFKSLTAKYGKFSILGNHDYADYARRTDEEREKIRRRIRDIHAEMGFDLLMNEHRVIEREGDQLLLVGVQTWGKGFRQSVRFGCGDGQGGLGAFNGVVEP